MAIKHATKKNPGDKLYAEADWNADHEIEPHTIETDHIADNAVTTGKLEDGAVTTDKLRDNAVTSAKIADQAVATDKIKDLAVTTAKIADNAITTSKIADGAVTTAKTNFTDQYLFRNSSVIFKQLILRYLGTGFALQLDRDSTSDIGAIGFLTGGKSKWLLGLRQGSDRFKLYNYEAGADILDFAEDGKDVDINTHLNINQGMTIKAGGAVEIQGTADGDLNIYAGSGRKLYLGANATWIMCLTSAGKVGIGTAYPGEKLQVAGRIKATSLYRSNVNYAFCKTTAGRCYSDPNWEDIAELRTTLSLYSTGIIYAVAVITDQASGSGIDTHSFRLLIDGEEIQVTTLSVEEDKFYNVVLAGAKECGAGNREVKVQCRVDIGKLQICVPAKQATLTCFVLNE